MKRLFGRDKMKKDQIFHMVAPILINGDGILCMTTEENGICLASGFGFSHDPKGVTCKRCLRIMAARRKRGIVATAQGVPQTSDAPGMGKIGDQE